MHILRPFTASLQAIPYTKRNTPKPCIHLHTRRARLVRVHITNATQFVDKKGMSPLVSVHACAGLTYLEGPRNRWTCVDLSLFHCMPPIFITSHHITSSPLQPITTNPPTIMTLTSTVLLLLLLLTTLCAASPLSTLIQIQIDTPGHYTYIPHPPPSFPTLTN
jgi:hypothetical protein